MALNNAVYQYQQNSVMTATPEELTLMLYNGCLKAIRFAKVAIEDKDEQVKDKNALFNDPGFNDRDYFKNYPNNKEQINKFNH